MQPISSPVARSHRFGTFAAGVVLAGLCLLIALDARKIYRTKTASPYPILWASSLFEQAQGNQHEWVQNMLAPLYRMRELIPGSELAIDGNLPFSRWLFFQVAQVRVVETPNLTRISAAPLRPLAREQIRFAGKPLYLLPEPGATAYVLTESSEGDAYLLLTRERYRAALEARPNLSAR